MTEQFSFTPDLTNLIKDIPADSIVSRTFYQNDRIKAILFGFAEGQVLSEHTSARPAILHFVKGEAKLTLGGTEQEGHPDTWVYMEPNLSHSILAESDLLMLLIMM